VLHAIALLTVGLALLAAIVLFFAVDEVPLRRGGWVAVVACVGILPLLGTASGTSHAVATSSTTEFCLECHEMQEYGRSLFIDDASVLPATHYQNRLVPRESACYACHKDYAIFGDLKAKLNGLRHVWVHYLGDVPEQMDLYQPYPNANCLHCHEDARRYLDAGPHQDRLDALASGEESCLACHGKGHAFEQVEEGNLWLAP